MNPKQQIAFTHPCHYRKSTPEIEISFDAQDHFALNEADWRDNLFGQVSSCSYMGFRRDAVAIWNGVARRSYRIRCETGLN
ncbi:MAG: hypothetical protein WAN35_10845 [Terracidiphilus sp.]